MRNNDSSTTGGNARAGASSTTSPTTTPSTPATANTSAPKTYGHGSRESDIGHVTGAYVGEEKARRDRERAGVKTIPSKIPGEPPTIRGETVEQMRERVAREREEAPATPFQASLTGRRPGDMGPGAEGTDVIGGAAIAPAAGVAGETSTTTGSTTGGTAR